MPEGPEIWRAADNIDEALTHRRINQITFSFEKLTHFEDILNGTTVTSVQPRGKAIITTFSNNLVMYSHNQLYGKWLVRALGDKPNTNRSLRVEIKNDAYAAYLYSASEVEILEKKQVENHSYIHKLGPDVLHPSVGYDEVLERFTDETFQNRKITTLLLDQGFLSGIGNYLRSEILFYACANPFKKLKSFTDATKKSMARAAIDLSRRSYETGGITNDPSIVEALKREKAPRKEYRHFVYGRTNNRCHKCGTVIEEDKTGGRKVYYCPNCQLADKV